MSFFVLMSKLLFFFSFSFFKLDVFYDFIYFVVGFVFIVVHQFVLLFISMMYLVLCGYGADLGWSFQVILTILNGQNSLNSKGIKWIYSVGHLQKIVWNNASHFYSIHYILSIFILSISIPFRFYPSPFQMYCKQTLILSIFIPNV